MPPLQKAPLTRAFVMFDCLHDNNLSSAKTKSVQNIWVANESEKLRLMVKILKKVAAKVAKHVV